MTIHDAAGTPLKRTPLWDEHRRLGARLVEFNGWEMPVQYKGILDEHRAVRTRAGLFDICHMGEFGISGAGALAFLQWMVPNDVERLTINQALYTQFCKPDGGVVDDLLIYRLAEEAYLLVINAGNIATDLAWVREHSTGYEVQIDDQSDKTGLLALQGPEAQTILQPLTSVKLADIGYYHCAPGLVSGISCLISRTGYTGEDGFELYCAAGEVLELWRALLAGGQERGLLPTGLGARDTLRLEAAYCLYGHELTEQTNPLEAGLSWSVKLGKGNFLGHDALARVKSEGTGRRLVGIELVERGVARGGYPIFDGERQIGEVTSGAPSPMLNKPIGLGYVQATLATPGRTLQVDIRGRRTAARIVSLPFYKRSQ